MKIYEEIYDASEFDFWSGAKDTVDILTDEELKTVFNLLKEINQEFKSTFILITHDKKVDEQADRIIEIKDGRVNMDIYN